MRNLSHLPGRVSRRSALIVVAVIIVVASFLGGLAYAAAIHDPKLDQAIDSLQLADALVQAAVYDEDPKDQRAYDRHIKRTREAIERAIAHILKAEAAGDDLTPSGR